MNKTVLYIGVLLLFANLISAQEIPYVKVLFDNSSMPNSYFYSKVSFEGNSWVKNEGNKLPVSSKIFFTPKNALLLEYNSAEKGNWKVSIAYHNIRGLNYFQKAENLSFWIFFPSTVDVKSLPNLRLKLNRNDFSNSVQLQEFISEVRQNNWIQVSIPLSRFGNNLQTETISGLELSQSSPSELNQVFYLDQIEFLPNPSSVFGSKTPKLISAKGYQKHIDLRWEKVTDSLTHYVRIFRKGSQDSEFKYIGVQDPWISGYTDFVGDSKDNFTYRISFLSRDYSTTSFSNELESKTKEMTDEQLLDMVQESHFRYYWDGAEPHSGLALENIPGRTTMIATGASGFGIMAIVVGVKRGFITRDEASQRLLKIVRYLSTADRFHGAFPHFLDGQTGKVVPFFGLRDNGADLVETSFLMQGLLVAKEFFDEENSEEIEISSTIEKLWQEIEWDWFRQESSPGFLTWHWSPDQYWTIDHQLIGWNETMITYFLAIASPTHSVPASMYYSGWASQSEKAQQYRKNWGKTEDGSMYTNGNTYYGIALPVGVSNGGPLFFIHYSYFALDPHKLTDAYVNYFNNNQRIAQINQNYCIDNPENHLGYGEDFWGLTASDGPYGYSADEPNVENDKGKITPTGALASFPYTPEASMKALKNYYQNYGNYWYGYYGFYDAMSLDDNWRSSLYMGLNQAPIVIMIENYRSGFVWDLFMKNEDVKRGLELLNKETERKKL